MKKTISGIAIFCLFIIILPAQEIGRLKNKWTGAYLNTEGGTLKTSAINQDWRSALWQLAATGNDQYRIGNVGDGTFLNIETGGLVCTAIDNSWLSALWIVKSIGGISNLKGMNNVWKPNLYINVEKGLGCTPILDGWLSAQWEYEVAGAGTPAPQVAQTNPDNNNPSTSFFNKQLALDAHNMLRSQVGVPPLVWSDDLAARAQQWANKVASKNMGDAFVLEHSQSNFGENIAGGFVTGDSPEKRIQQGWGEAEKVNFNTATRQCFGGKTCGHYSQIVWRNTARVGCAVAANPNGKYILVCNYDPPGNYVGQPAY